MAEYQTQPCYQPLSPAVINGGARIAQISSQFYLLFGAVLSWKWSFKQIAVCSWHGGRGAGPGLLSEPYRGALKYPL